MLWVGCWSLLTWEILARPSEDLQPVHMSESLADVAYPDAFFRISQCIVDTFINEGDGIMIGR